MEQKHVTWIAQFYAEMQRRIKTEHIPETQHDYGGFHVHPLLDNPEDERMDVAAAELLKGSGTGRLQVFKFTVNDDPVDAAHKVTVWVMAQPEYKH